MNIYKKWIEKKEIEGFEVHKPIKLEHPFEWGLDYLGLSDVKGEPKNIILEYSKKNIQQSKNFFCPKPLPLEAYQLNDNNLTFTSTITTQDEINNEVKVKYFPSSDKTNAIIIVQHWNSQVEKYDKICRLLQKIGFTSFRMTLPYHGKRSPDSVINSTKLVSANIGLTIQSIQQSVQDILSLVNWMEHSGFKKIGIMGASIGSCCSFLAAAHDARINGFFGNLMSGYFGDVVWTGISTQHIRKSVEPYISQEDLRNLWMLNSPIAFLDQLKKYNPSLKQFIMSAKYDTTFRFSLTEEFFTASKKKNIIFQKKVLPSGHYTLGKYWFKLIDGYYIVRFFRNLFK